ncbi:MAG: hypothetical protein ABL901_10715 [Hyphomicrobiaceae bacterium]
MNEQRRSLVALLDAHTDVPFEGDVLEERGFIERVAMALYDRHEQFSRWPESVRHFYACYDLNFQVGSGGFAQAAYNIPHLIPVAQEAFEQFGRTKAAELCSRAVALLPAELVEHMAKGFTGEESLEGVFDHFNESAMNELSQNLPSEFWADGALQSLVQRHRKDFASVDRLG